MSAPEDTEPKGPGDATGAAASDDAKANERPSKTRLDRSKSSKKVPLGKDGPLGKISRANRRRLVFYPLLFGGILAGLLYCTAMPGKSWSGTFTATAEESRVAKALERDVTELAGKIGARNVEDSDTLQQAERYVTTRFKELRYSPERLSYDVGLRSVANVEVTLVGSKTPKEIVVVGAHYDSAFDAPGADDNASGIAALFALAERFSAKKPERTLKFVAFANEEPPRFWTEKMGSLVYAKACRARGDDIKAMLSLETVGYFREESGTQKYPPPMSFFYSDKGNFIGFVGNTSSRSLTRDTVQVFRASTEFPSEGAALPSFIAGVGWSDQWSFWQAGYPGVMVTDTAPFRNPNYHKLSDTPETLDYLRLARVVSGLEKVVQSLSRTP